jgi:hypothetical protein
VLKAAARLLPLLEDCAALEAMLAYDEQCLAHWKRTFAAGGAGAVHSERTPMARKYAEDASLRRFVKTLSPVRVTLHKLEVAGQAGRAGRPEPADARKVATCDRVPAERFEGAEERPV